MLNLIDVSVIFGKNSPLEKRALKNISFEIKNGEFITILGKNAAGKSTLQSVIAGDIPINNGRILLNNNDITNTKAYQRAKFIARVFQDPKAGTCENLTIAENMSLAFNRNRERKIAFAINAKKKEFFREKLNYLGMGLENRLDDLVSSLSGGQRQALSLLMATLSNADLLLLDEHTAALDPKMATHVMEITAKLHKELNLSILMITHDLKQALEYGKRIIILKNGEIEEDLTGASLQNFSHSSLFETY